MEPGAELIRADTAQSIEGSELQAAEEELGLPQCGEVVEGGVAFDSTIDSQLSRAVSAQPIDGSELQAAEELGLQQCGEVVEGGVAFDSFIDSQLICADTAQPIDGSELQATEELGLPQCGEVLGGVAFDSHSLIDSQLIGASSTRDEEQVMLFDSAAASAAEVAGDDAAAEPSAAVVKRRRGRPPKPRGGGSQRGRAPVKRKPKEEDEVCFICFDGGTLVVCDRGSCPKVYHPSCVNRDEAFFRTSGRWNCGWHICSICQKSAHYMCYTCTYSLCKKCIKEAGFICIRGPKGFCATCYKTIMLIELNEVEVDFDNKNSWEHLFKLYWLKLKGKLSFSVEELSGAKNPRKGSSMVALNKNSSDESYNANDDEESSSNSFECHVGSNSKRKKARRDYMIPVPDNSSVNQAPKARRDSKIPFPDNSSVNQVLNEAPLASEDTEWASKELLEFVAHMKDGSTHILSQFDVQALLLEYVKRNNLRDPRRKSQIVCDPRLQNLFGKPRVGHFEMLKLLELHFLIKETQQIVTDENKGGVGYPDSNQMDAEGYGDPVTKVGSNKRRKNKKRFEDREPQTNLDDYAAIDVHNINLIYLRRNLIEDLIDDFDKFNEKVTGAFVRIRIPSTGQRQDMYRLVQVVGTHKAAEKYKLGKKTTDITLEILNLHKTEVMTIDTISNQEFTEEECKRLRQSIKCGLINPLRVGEVQEKIKVLQAVRVNDWLENEKQRLSHLRDRASEKGRRKELRECVEKLQLLSTPEERRRRLNEIPELHADPKMDPAYASAEGEADDKKQDKLGRPRESLSLGKGKEPVSEKSSSIVKNNWSDGRKSLDKVDLFSSFGDRTSMLYSSQAKDVTNSDRGSPNLLADTNGVEAGGWNNNQHTMKVDESCGSTDDDRIWNYIDPSGITHGQFSMAQLRKWNTTGYFPSDLRIWTSEKQDESLLLTDALIGKFQRNPPFPKTQHNSFPQPASFPTPANGTETEWQGGWGVDSSMSRVDTNQNKWQLDVVLNHATLSAADNTGTESANRFINSGLSSRSWETSKNPNAWSGQPKPQIYSSPRPTASFPGTEGNASIWNQGQSQGPRWNSDWPRGPPPSVQIFERQQAKWSSLVQPQLANDSTDQWGYGSFDPPSPTPQPSGGSWASAHFEQVSSGLGATGVHVSHQSPATTTEPNNSAIANSNGGWVSSPAPNLPNGSGTEDGGGSWSADGWSSRSTASAHKPKTAEPMDASLSLNNLVDSHASNRQKSALEDVALQPIELDANLQSVSSLAAEDVANRNLISKTLDLATTNTLFFGAQDNELNDASIKPITEWSPPSPTPSTKSSGRDLVADGTSVNRQIGGTGTSQVISNVGWGTAIQGNTNKVWGTPHQGNTYAGTSWGAPPDGFTSNAVWGAPAWGNTMNLGSSQGNSNLNLGWGPQKNFDRYDHGQDGYHNKEWPSRPPPGGEQGQIGVCKFHQSGYCKKGSSCKYLHQ